MQIHVQNTNYCNVPALLQYDDIVLLIEPGVTFIKRDAFYTAISRAKKRCIIVTMPSDLDRCQNPADSCISFFLKYSEEYQFDII